MTINIALLLKSIKHCIVFIGNLGNKNRKVDAQISNVLLKNTVEVISGLSYRQYLTFNNSQLPLTFLPATVDSHLIFFQPNAMAIVAQLPFP